MMDDLRPRVLLSVQRALVGEISPEMRAISVQWSPQEIRLHVYVDGPVLEKTVEDFDAGVMTQIVADFCWPERGDPRVEFELIRVDVPHRIESQGLLVFGRSES